MSNPTTHAPTNDDVLGYIRDVLGPTVCMTITTCAVCGYGAARDLPAILAAARAMALDDATSVEPIVAAAFGFLRRSDGEYVDTLGDTSDCWPDELPVLSGKDAREVAAFALARAVVRDGGQFVVC